MILQYKPKLSKPIKNSTHPAKKHKRTTKSTGMSRVYCKVTRAIKDDGPIDTSLIVPKKMYRKPPIKQEYRPYWKYYSSRERNCPYNYKFRSIAF